MNCNLWNSRIPTKRTEKSCKDLKARVRRQEEINKIMYSREEMEACPVEGTSRIFDKKVTILLIRNMAGNQTKFSQFLESIEQMR